MAKWWSRPGWAALGAILVALLFAVGYARSFDFGGLDPSCVEVPPEGIEAELEVLITNEGTVGPRAKASMLIDLPENNRLAQDLLRRNRHDDQHKQALRCLLGMPVLPWRRQPPSVTKEGERILVRVETSESIPLVPDREAKVGALVIHTFHPRQWEATIHEPKYLTLARWREVTVTAPVGWLSFSPPDVSAQLIRWERPLSDAPGSATERIRWERPARQAVSDVNLASFTIHPDLRTQIASTSRTTPWVWAPDVLYSLSALLLVGTLVLWARRDRAVLVRRMCLPILVVAVAMTVAELGTDYGWLVWPWNLVPHALVILAAAAIWGVPRWLWLSVGLGVLLLFGYSGSAALLSGVATVSIDPRYEVGVWTFLAFQLTVVLVAGIVNAARVLLSKAPAVRPPSWVWWCGIACAALLVAERFANIYRFSVIPWANSQPRNAGFAVYAMMMYPAGILHAVEIFLPVLAVIGVWALIRKRVEDGRPIRDRYVVLLFLMGSAVWNVAPFGLWLPVWPLALLVLWLWLRDQRTLLDTPLSRPGSTVRSVIDSHTASELRAATAQWGRIRQRGRALDRDLAKGTITIDAHAEETQKLLDIHLLSNADAETVRQLRAKTVTPVDMMLAVGPGATPWDNAKWGVKIVALTSIPAVLLSLWLKWQTSSLASSAMAVLGWTGIVAWEVTTWLAAGAVLGLLWQRLRFRRGIAKALPLITAYAAAQLVTYATVELTGDNSIALISIALFTVVITFAALLMDVTTLRTADTWWSRPRNALAAAYGMENLSTQVAFVATQAVAVVTIISLIQGGIADQPSVPTHNAPTEVQDQP